jgi:hypothetical protein
MVDALVDRTVIDTSLFVLIAAERDPSETAEQPLAAIKVSVICYSLFVVRSWFFVRRALDAGCRMLDAGMSQRSAGPAEPQDWMFDVRCWTLNVEC